MKLNNYIASIIENYGISRNHLDHLVMNALDIDLTQLYNIYKAEIDSNTTLIIQRAVDAHIKNIPLARILRYKYFWKDKFYVSPFTLDPRSDTETLVESAIKLNPGSVLDVGTGTGCILLSILRELPSCYGIGIDISKYAIETAIYNANQLDLQAKFHHARIADISDRFDLIISNPPYVLQDCSYEALFDPPLALWDNGCYEEIIASKNLLNPNGSILLEVPSYSIKRLQDLAAENSLTPTLHKFSNDINILKLSNDIDIN